MRRSLLAAALLFTGCATTFSAGGHVTDGCTQYIDPRVPEYKVYGCLRPFPSQQRALKGENCSWEVYAWRGAHGPTVGCGWTAGFTDKQSREIFFYEVFPEALDHEILHAKGLIDDAS